MIKKKEPEAPDSQLAREFPYLVRRGQYLEKRMATMDPLRPGLPFDEFEHEEMMTLFKLAGVAYTPSEYADVPRGSRREEEYARPRDKPRGTRPYPAEMQDEAFERPPLRRDTQEWRPGGSQRVSFPPRGSRYMPNGDC